MTDGTPVLNGFQKRHPACRSILFQFEIPTDYYAVTLIELSANSADEAIIRPPLP
jgi:hypothetical protein